MGVHNPNVNVDVPK
jgi:alpha-tubulin suppressor-like RCC1 family protein